MRSLDKTLLTFIWTLEDPIANTVRAEGKTTISGSHCIVKAKLPFSVLKDPCYLLSSWESFRVNRVVLILLLLSLLLLLNHGTFSLEQKRREPFNSAWCFPVSDEWSEKAKKALVGCDCDLTWLLSALLALVRGHQMWLKCSQVRGQHQHGNIYWQLTRLGLGRADQQGRALVLLLILYIKWRGGNNDEGGQL